MATANEPTEFADGGLIGSTDDPYIRVRSVWKVFGRGPEKVLDPQYAGQDKAFFQAEFNNVIGLQGRFLRRSAR